MTMILNAINNPLRLLNRHERRSIALVLTLALMSLILILVLAFATVTKTDLQTAAANRDVVASKYYAQAAYQRAMADIVAQYLASPATATNGLTSFVSVISANPSVAAVPAAATNYVTDLESVTTNLFNGRGKVTPGADGNIDFVVLPSAVSNFIAGTSPQWLGIKDTNGDLIGRIAYTVNGAGLCINAVGNMDIGTNGALNARNQGLGVPELNLPAALVAMGWTWAAATNDTMEVLRYRYGGDNPGVSGVDDDGNASTVIRNGLDDDADGQVDNAGDGTDEPQEYLSSSDGTTAAVITPIGNDVIFTDLKQLYTVTNLSVAAAGRFQSNFSTVQKFLCTQSPVLMDTNMIWLNDPAYSGSASPNAFFTAITNKFFKIGAFNNNQTQQVQVAANIVTYQDSNSFAPFNVNNWGRPFVGVARNPLINEVVYEIVAHTERQIVALPSVHTNVIITMKLNLHREAWHPYTNNWPPSGSQPVDFGVAYGITNGTAPFGSLAVATDYINNAFSSMAGAASVAACTNASQFLVYSNLSVSTFGGATLTADQSTFTNNITFSGFAVGGQIRRNGPNVPVYDYVPAGTLPVSVTFTPGDLTNLLTGFSPLFKEATNIVSIAWNDPRCKTNWMAQYTGLVQNLPTAPYSYVGNRGTLGMRNATNANVLLNNFLPVFTPQASNADDRLVTLPIPGIYTNTFYIAKRGYWRSAGELGRVHRSVPWGTIDFRGGAYRVYPQDSVFLDHFTTLAPATNGSAAYIHGRINVNSPSGGANISPIWAALFAGMPLWDGSYMDYAGANLTTTMPFATQMQNFMTARKYNTLSALCSVDQLSNVQSYYASAPAQLNDEAREWFVDRLVNLVSTKGSGNFFTIYAWGQALSGSSTNFSAKRVAGETLIISMVQPQLSTVGPNNFVSLKTVYFRYNPDLEFYDPGFTWTPGTN